MTVVERPASSSQPPPRRPRRRAPRSRMKIALLGILGIAIIVYGVFTKRVPFLHGYRVDAVFQDANQLTPGFSPVRVAGVTVGKVVGVKDGPGASSIVTMELSDEALPLHVDARARIRPRLFLEGGFYVDLQPGSPSGAVLEDGDQIPMRQTAIPVQLSQILSSFDRSTREDFKRVIAGLDAGFSNGGAEALSATWKPLGPLLRDTAQVFEGFRGVRDNDLSQTIRNSAKVTSALASREQELRGLVTSLARTTSTLATHDTQLAASIRELDRLLQEAPEQLDRIDATVPSVRRFANSLRPSLRVAPPVLEHTAATLRQLKGLTSQSELGGAVDGLLPAVRRLPKIEDQLNILLPLTTPVTGCVRDRVVPTVDLTVPDGPLSTGQPVWLDLAHALVGLASAGQTFDANGFDVRYLAGGGTAAVSTTDSADGGTIAGLAPQAVQGARPQWLGNGVTPPFRPDIPCLDNALPDLSQRASIATSARMQSRRAVDERAPVTEDRLATTIEGARTALQGTGP